MKTDIYSPIQVLKTVADNIWIVDGPLINFKGLDFPTRMTVIRLESGELFIHSPIALTPSLQDAIDQLGPVKYLISPNKIHYWWIGQWHACYPDAKAYCLAGKQNQIKNQHSTFDGVLGESPEPEWARDIDQLWIKGSCFLEEMAFFHKSSHTLILTDLIENFDQQRIRSRALQYVMKAAGILAPNGKLPIDLRLSYLGHRGQLKTAIKTMLSWQPSRIIIAHGDCFETDAVAELKRAFSWAGVK